MSQRTAAVTAASAVLVLLCFGAAFLGARMGAPEQVSEDVRPVSSTSLREQIEELNRQLGYLEGRTRKLEEGVGTALALGAENQTRIEAIERAMVIEETDDPEPPVTDTGDDESAAQDPPTEDAPASPEQAATDEEDPMMPFALKTQRMRLESQLRLLADSTPKGRENRRTQGFAEAQQMAVALGVAGESADELRSQFLDYMEDSAEKVGPYVRQGIEEADAEVVKKQFEQAWTQFDVGLQELLDEETWKNAAKLLEGQRELMRQVLDEHRDARLNR